MIEVIKRDGRRTGFDPEKVANAVVRAMREVNEPDADKKAKEVADVVKDKLNTDGYVTVEHIQDLIETILMLAYPQTAKAYILYRDKKNQERKNPWADLDYRQKSILSKYTLPNETIAKFLKRISLGNPNLEKIFRNREAIWGGRNLYAIGRDGNITGSNCYVTRDPEDNLEDIYRADYEIAKTYAYGGGQGMNLSKLRPRGMKVNNTSATTPGVMTFAEKYSYTTLNTQQENRRGALMLVMNIDHPDILDFITAKLDLSKINGANISLAITDEFMQAVSRGESWKTTFETDHEVLTRTFNATALMEAIGYAAHTMGDPGVLFIDNVNDYHMLSNYDNVKFTATNPCGEQPLTANGSCNLASINLNAFVRNPFKDNASFDMKRFGEVVKEMVNGLDDLLDLLGDRHPLKEQREHVKQWREIGLGVMGLADLALSMKLGYGSPEFISKLHDIMHHMINFALQASSQRAGLLGSFPEFDADKILRSDFIASVATAETKESIRNLGLRNSRLLSIAPTGSISNVLGVSGGVEPYYMLSYRRHSESMNLDMIVLEKTPMALANELGVLDEEHLPDWAKVTSKNIPIEKRILVQETIQLYVDTAISSTVNLPNEATVDDVINVYKTSWESGLKGITVFRDRCAKIGILAGVNDDTRDLNPATAPAIDVETKIYDKHADELRRVKETIKIGSKNTQTYFAKSDLCPVCEAPLIRKNGCTACSSCDYEKCAL